MKLDYGDKHLLRLIRQGQDGEGWAAVSKIIFPLIKGLPDQLVIWEETAEKYRAKLTDTGNAILDWI